jgi:hypothetical protein
MIRNKIKNWFKDIINLGMDVDNDDVNVNIAKANYQKYQDELERQRRNYIKTVCNVIKMESRNGSKSITTATLLEDFMNYEFMMEMKEYFEQRGFHVKEESNCSGILTSWLRISWE